MVRDKLRILVGIRGRGDTADAYYRALAPWSVVRYWAGDRVDLAIQRLEEEGIRWADVVVAQRPNTAEDEILCRMARDLGKPLIVDVDDNLFDIPPSAGDMFDHYKRRGSLEIKAPLAFHKRCLLLADVVTVPTERLGTILEERCGRALRMMVLPNGVMKGDWDWLEPMKAQWGKDKLTVGWFGHFYHWDDFRAIVPVLDDVLQAHDANLVIMGFPEVTECFPRRLRERTFIEDLIPFSQMSTVRQLIKTFDVGLCPLEESAFAWGKSPLKAIQYGMAGVVPVCSSVVYGALPELCRLGLTADTPKQFGWILANLLQDEQARREKAEAWRQAVWEHYCYDSLREDGRGGLYPNALLWLFAAEEAMRCRSEKS